MFNNKTDHNNNPLPTPLSLSLSEVTNIKKIDFQLKPNRIAM